MATICNLPNTSRYLSRPALEFAQDTREGSAMEGRAAGKKETGGDATFRTRSVHTTSDAAAPLLQSRHTRSRIADR